MVVTLYLSIIVHPTNSLRACAHSVSSKSCLSISVRRPVERILQVSCQFYKSESICGFRDETDMDKRRRVFAKKLVTSMCLFKDFIGLDAVPSRQDWILYRLQTRYLSLWETQPRRSCASEASRDQRRSSEKPERLSAVHAIYIMFPNNGKSACSFVTLGTMHS